MHSYMYKLISLLFFSLLEFQQLCDETHSWINEKDQALSSEDCGRDLSSVQALQRRHQVQKFNFETNFLFVHVLHPLIRIRDCLAAHMSVRS